MLQGGVAAPSSRPSRESVAWGLVGGPRDAVCVTWISLQSLTVLHTIGWIDLGFQHHWHSERGMVRKNLDISIDLRTIGRLDLCFQHHWHSERGMVRKNLDI